MCKVTSASIEYDPILRENGLERRLILTFDDGAVIEYCGSFHMDRVIKPVKLVNIKKEDPGNKEDSFYASIAGTPGREGIAQTVFDVPNCVNTDPVTLADYLQSAHEYAQELINAFKSGRPSSDLGVKVNQDNWKSTFIVWHAIRFQGPSKEYITGLRSRSK